MLGFDTLVSMRPKLMVDGQQLTEEDVRVVVDLTDFNSDGTHRVEPLILVDGFDNVGAVGPYIVTCRVSSK